MKLINAEQMRSIDREAIDNFGIPSLELMEDAGEGIAVSILSDIVLDEESARFSIFCGKGNNGGDGLVIARYLYNAGMEIEIFYLGPPDQFSDDAKVNFDKLAETEIDLYEIKSSDDLPEILESDYIIDALFGTGFEGTPRGITSEIIDYINEQFQPVIAVDMPSGLDASTGKFEGDVVEADYTYTLALPKYGLYTSPGREVAGMVQVVPIGIPDEVVEKFKLYDNLIDDDLVFELLPERDPEGHKGDFGKLLLLAGSNGMTGAAVLAAKSALRAGCGLTKIAAPKTVLPIIATMFPEATGLALPDVAKKGALALRGLGEVKKVIKEHDAVIVGPGIGINHETKELVLRTILSLEKPAVIDADGLNALVGELQVLEDCPSDLILTPHPGEFQRLSGNLIETDLFKRIEQARKFAIEHQTILVLKGSPTVVAHINGQIWVNSSGNNGMATGGSGDVLSGIIGSLLAQGAEPIDAALAGVYLHGLAGDIAALELGERSVIASDLIDFLPDAFEMIE